MSKSHYSLYIQDNFKLARSIVIKNELTALTINAELERRGFVVDDDPATWKYHLNLAGLPHASDVPMTVTSVDTLETINFDLDTLSQHRATLLEFKLKSSSYIELVNRFPEQESLIDGIINPTQLNEVLSARDWEIISYDVDLVEPQETDLIPKLQSWVDSFTNRWLNPDYRLLENLYPAAFLGTLYTQLSTIIPDIRLGNCKTSTVHTFHIWSYLDGYHTLGDFRDALTIRQALWLYRNIDTIARESYTKETFETLIEHILTERGIPFYGYHLRQEASELENGIAGQMYRHPLNFVPDDGSSDDTREIRSVLFDGRHLAQRNPELLESEVTRTDALIKGAKADKYITRIVESDIRDKTNVHGISLPELLITQWLDMADNTTFSTNPSESGTVGSKYRARISINDPLSDTNIRLNASEAWILAMWLKAKVDDVDLTDVPEVTDWHAIKRKIPTLAELKQFTKNTNITDELLEHTANFPTIGTVVSAITFRQHVEILHKFILEQKFQVGDQELLFNHMGLLKAVNYMYEPRTYKFTELTYDQWFTGKGLNLNELSKHDAGVMLKEIVDQFTGNTGIAQLTTFQVQTAMLEIIKRLANYDLQYLQNLNESPIVLATNKTMRISDVRVRGIQNILIQNKQTDNLDVRTKSSMRLKHELNKLKIDGTPTGKHSTTIDTTVKEIVSCRVKARVIVPLAYMKYTNTQD